jgi:hypothetical protein
MCCLGRSVHQRRIVIASILPLLEKKSSYIIQRLEHAEITFFDLFRKEGTTVYDY